MGKVDIEFSAECSQSSICRIKQGVCGDIIHRLEPFALEDSPQRLCYVKMRAVWRKKEKEQAALLPYRTKFPHELAPVYARIVKHNKCVLVDAERKLVNKVRYLVGGHILGGRESLISVVAVYHAEDVEPQSSFRRDVNILTAELPAEVLLLLFYEFLQLLALIRIELRRGFPLGTFSYTSISRAKADKKALKVLALASLPEACCHASFAFFTLCLSFSMALRTISSSELSMMGLRPRPGRVSRPLIPSVSKRFTHELTDMWVISVCSPTFLEVRPLDFNSIARQRIRNAWLLPVRKPSSNCRRCSSVSSITLIIAIVVSL